MQLSRLLTKAQQASLSACLPALFGTDATSQHKGNARSLSAGEHARVILFGTIPYERSANPAIRKSGIDGKEMIAVELQSYNSTAFALSEPFQSFPFVAFKSENQLTPAL